MDGPFQLRHPDEFAYVARGGRYYSSGFVIRADRKQTLTLPYQMPQYAGNDMCTALTRENAWMITNRDYSTGRAITG